MPRGSNTQTRTFVYKTGTTVGGLLLSATNPENGTVAYNYNTDMVYTYDSLNRLATAATTTTSDQTNRPGDRASPMMDSAICTR